MCRTIQVRLSVYTPTFLKMKHLSQLKVNLAAAELKPVILWLRVQSFHYLSISCFLWMAQVNAYISGLMQTSISQKSQHFSFSYGSIKGYVLFCKEQDKWTPYLCIENDLLGENVLTMTQIFLFFFVLSLQICFASFNLCCTYPYPFHIV